MKTRHVYDTPDLETAKAVMVAARRAGVHDDDILLVARSDIELEEIPNRRKEADTDFFEAAKKGVGFGAGTGLLAGLVAVVVTPLGITLAGAALAAFTGAAVGGLAASLMGSALPDPIRQKFDELIQQGHILVLIDAEDSARTEAEFLMTQAGGTRLPYEEMKAV